MAANRPPRRAMHRISTPHRFTTQRNASNRSTVGGIMSVIQPEEPDLNPRSAKPWAERDWIEEEDLDELRGARGILFGLFLSIPLWVVIIWVISLLVSRFYP